METNRNQHMTMTATAHRSVHRAGAVSEKEVEVSFYSESEVACCGEVLRPFWADDGRYLGICGRCGQKFTDKSEVRYGLTPWIGVDLDGTLARDTGSDRSGKNLDEIGSPIKPMVNRLKKWIAEGKTVKIFTARASAPKQVAMIKKWLLIQGLPGLEVTNVKDLGMVELWDDRCVQVMTNSGEPIQEAAVHAHDRQVLSGWLERRSASPSLLSRFRILLTF